MKHILLILLFSVSLSFHVAGGAVTDKLFLNFEKAYWKYDKKFKESNGTLLDSQLIRPSIKSIVDYFFSSKVNNDEFSLLIKAVRITQSTDKTGYVPCIISQELLKRVDNDTVNIQQKQEILCFIMKYQLLEDKLNIGLYPILNTFYSAELYNDKARKILKQKLLRNELTSGVYLFLLDAANMYNDKEVMTYLQKESSKCTRWDKDSKWFSLLLLARHGDVQALDKIVKISTQRLEPSLRTYQVFYMPFQLSVIPNEKIVDVLKGFLPSKEKYRMSIVDIANLSAYSALALHAMLLDFPPVSKDFIAINKVKPSQIQSYTNWLENNKPYRYRPITEFPKQIKMRLWNK